ELGFRAARGAGRRHDRRGEREGSLDDAANRILQRALERGLVVRNVELAAAVLGRLTERVVRGLRLRRGCVDGDAEAHRVNDDVLKTRERGRVILGVAVRRFGGQGPGARGLPSVPDVVPEVRLSLPPYLAPLRP